MRAKKRSLAARALIAVGSGLLMVGILVFALFLALSSGPVSVPFIKDRVADALEARIGAGVDVDVGDAKLERTANGIEVHVYDVVFRDGAGKEILRSPEALVALDPLRLAALQIVPRRLSLRNMTVRAEVRPDGEVRLTTAGAAGKPEPSARLDEALGFLAVMAKTGTFSGLSAVSLADSRLVIDDKRVGRELAFEKVNAAFESASNGRSAIEGSVSRSGATIPFRLEARSDGPGAELSLAIMKVPLSVAATASGLDMLHVGGSSDLTLAAKLKIAADGKPQSGTLDASLAPGTITIPAWPGATLAFQEAKAEAVWTGVPDKLERLSFRFRSPDGEGVLSGPVLLPAAGRPEYRFEARTEGLTLAPLAPSDKPLAVTDGRLIARVGAQLDRLLIENLSLDGPDTLIRLSGDAARVGDDGTAKLHLTVGRMPLRAAVRWWPAFVAPGTRRYLADAILDGQLETLSLRLDLAQDDFRRFLKAESLSPPALKLEIVTENATLRPIGGLPPVAGLTGAGKLDAEKAEFSAARGLVDLPGGGKRIQLTDGLLQIAKLDTWTPDLSVSFRAQAAAEHVAEFLALPKLRDTFPVSAPPQDIRGQFDGRIRIGLPLGRELKPGDVVTVATATLRGVTIDKAIGRDKLENATLNISADATGLEIKGEGRWQGMPVTVSLEGDAKDRSTATVLGFTMDDAAQKRFGLAGQVTGPLPVKIKADRGQGETMRAQVEVDLSRAAIDGLIPGFQKAAGRPGRLTFEAQERPKGYALQSIVLDSGSVAFRGQAEVAQDGSVTSARFSQFRLSPGDNVRLDFDRTPNGGRVVIRGNNFDSRPFLRAAQQDGTGGRGERDIDIDLKTTLLSGYGGEVLTGAEVRLQRRNGQLRQIAASGRLNGKQVTVSGQASDRAAPITIASDDAGAMLRYLDIYTRMAGGDLSGELRPTGGDIGGYLIARSFRLRDEPALRRLLSERPAGGDADSSAFTKMRIDFTRSGSNTVIKDAVIFGPAIGITFNGSVDTVRDRVSLSGTYIPAYGLNNAFAQIPVLGTILGGGRNEGLLAITFGVSGRASQPQVAVNPLSAVTPGIFRKLFEFRSDRTGSTGGVPSSTSSARPN